MDSTFGVICILTSAVTSPPPRRSSGPVLLFSLTCERNDTKKSSHRSLPSIFFSQIRLPDGPIDLVTAKFFTTYWRMISHSSESHRLLYGERNSFRFEKRIGPLRWRCIINSLLSSCSSHYSKFFRVAAMVQITWVIYERECVYKTLFSEA